MCNGEELSLLLVYNFWCCLKTLLKRLNCFKEYWDAKVIPYASELPEQASHFEPSTRSRFLVDCQETVTVVRRCLLWTPYDNVTRSVSPLALFWLECLPNKLSCRNPLPSWDQFARSLSRNKFKKAKSNNCFSLQLWVSRDEQGLWRSTWWKVLSRV